MAQRPNQGLKIVRAATVCSLLILVALPVWAGEKQGLVNETERAARIQELQRDRAKVERELRQLRSQPEGTTQSTVPRSEFSDQPTRNMKESLESLPGMGVQQGSTGHDIHLSIRGSK